MTEENKAKKAKYSNKTKTSQNKIVGEDLKR